MAQRYIFISWASSGIWAGLAQYFYTQKQFRLIITARNLEQQALLQAEFPHALVCIVDFNAVQSVEAFLVILHSKDIEYCIFAAGVGTYWVFRDIESSEIWAQFEVNTLAPLRIIHSNYTNFVHNHTKIIYFSSIVADISLKNMSIYGASKWAMNYALTILGTENPQLNILNLHLWAIKTPMHLKSGMSESKGRALWTVLPKLVFLIKNKSWNRYVYPDWWMTSHIAWHMISLFNLLKNIWKKYL
jgi:short-subunit dehydrogenase